MSGFNRTEQALAERLALLEQAVTFARNQQLESRRRIKLALIASPVVLGLLWGSAALSQSLTTFQPGQPASAAAVNANFQQLRMNLVPAGSILAFGGESIPQGYLLCNGQAVGRASFPELFAAIGTSWGNGNGTTTFNVPDFRGRFQRGAHAVTFDPTLDRAVGTAQGEDVVWHNHGASASSSTPDHRHRVAGYNAVTVNTSYVGTIPNGHAELLTPELVYWPGWAGHETLSISTSVTVQYTGGPETRPDNVAVNYIIRSL